MSDECLVKSVRELFSYYLPIASLEEEIRSLIRNCVGRPLTIRNAFYSRRQESPAIQGCHRK